MENKNKSRISNIVIIICFGISLIACLFLIHSQSKKLEELRSEHSELTHQLDSLSQRLYNLESQFRNMEHEITSLTKKLDYIVVGNGTKPNTVAYRIILTPKELAEDTAVEITIGDTTVPFTRNGETFTATVDIPMFEENEDHPILSVTSAGITKKDALEEIDLWYAYQNVLPVLYQSMNGTGSSEDPEKMEISQAYSFRLNPFANGTPITFTKVTMTKTVNGKEVANKDVTNSLRDSGGYDEYHTSFTMTNADQVVVLIRAEDSLGYIHELEIISKYDETCESIISDCYAERICASDGTVLYEDIHNSMI